MLSLSQSHLTILDACDRKYQYIFIDGLSGPSTYDHKATTQWGSQFHLMMQQRALNLPVEVMSGANAEMSDSLVAMAKAAPEVFAHLPVASVSLDDGEAFSQSEHRRTLVFNDYLLTVIYDLVVRSRSVSGGVSDGESPDQGQIFDWKTHQHPPRKEWLEADWQTRLYLYVLCETTNLRPEQLSMTYWFVRPGAMSGDLETELTAVKPNSAERQPTFYRFDYSANQHQQTQKDLQRLTDRLTQLLYLDEQSIDFPKVAIEKGLCDRCPFNLRCDRAPASIPTVLSLSPDPYLLLQTASQLSVNTVEEIPFSPNASA
ncbi:MAG: PD-(D/E)XK nuclease family protein [Phormidesmis sp.]